jgi:hypothetical protein
MGLKGSPFETVVSTDRPISMKTQYTITTEYNGERFRRYIVWDTEKASLNKLQTYT